MSCGIYKLTSPSGKSYVGQSIKIESRFLDYKRLKCKDQPKIYNALKKYGPNNFQFEILEQCDITSLDEMEKLYIKRLQSIKNGYNCRLGYSGSPKRIGVYKGNQNIEFLIDEVLYTSVGEASKKLGIPAKTIHNRLRSPNIQFTNYRYKNEVLVPIRRPRKIISNKEFYIDGTLFRSLQEAENILGIPAPTIKNRLISKTTSFAHYRYKNESLIPERRPRRQRGQKLPDQDCSRLT